MAGRSWLLEWATVTVQLWASSNCDHHGFQPRQIGPDRLQQFETAKRRAGHQTAGAGHQPPRIDRVEAVDILGRINRGNHGIRIEMGRQRQLDQYAIHRRVGIERRHHSQQFRLCRGFGQHMLDGIQARFLGHFDFGADIDLRSRIGADQNHRKAGHRMMARQNIGCIIGHFGAQMCCNGGAVNQLCGHTGDPLSLRLLCRAASSTSG